MSEAINYTGPLENIQKTSQFESWHNRLRRRRSLLYQAVSIAIVKLESGAGADRTSVGGGVWEYRHHGQPEAFRLYYGIVDGQPWLLCGGTKSNQQTDIDKAKTLLQEI